MLSRLPQPIIFAHRGASAYAPENTLASFELALQQKAEAIELDAKLSADGQIMVIHDSTVDRTTDGKGKVNQLPLSALKELDAGTFFNLQFKGEKIPTLEEVFEAVGRKLFINVELTNYASPKDDLPLKVAKLVKKHHLQEFVLFSSFSLLVLRRIKRFLPEVPIGLLTPSGIRGAWGRSLPWILNNHDALHPEVNDVSPKLIKNIYNRGKRIHVWTVNKTDNMKTLLEWGVDGIITDDPPAALRIRNDFISSH